MDENILYTVSLAIRAAEKLHMDYVGTARAALTALTQAGYAVVPVEPTKDMINAGGDGIAFNPNNVSDEVFSSFDKDALAAYRAMVRAALDTQQKEG